MIFLFTHPLDRGPWNDGPAFDDWLTPEAAPPIARRHLCFGGGKSGTSTQQQSASVGPPQYIVDRLNEVWGRATTAADRPFQTYGGEFVAPINAQQTAGISGINNASGLYAPYGADATTALTSGAAGAYPYFGAATGNLNQGLGAGQALSGQSLGTLGHAYAGAQPYNQAATGLTLAGGQGASPTALDQSSINQYLSPYLGDVLSSTLANLHQQQGQEQSGLAGNAIQSGAFGGDRAGVASANLARQQDLATGQTVSGILNQGYNTALGTAQQQQGLGLSAQQANLARLSGAGQQLAGLGAQQFGQGAQTAQQQAALAAQLFGQGLGASQQQQALGQGIYGIGQGVSQGLSGLGTTAQTNALNAGQAQIGAGTLQQQTQQAKDAALYNQFLQQQAYPFQTSQFLANIAQGTSPLYGSTTNSYGSSTQPMSFFKRGGAVHDLEMDDNGEYRLRRASGGLSANDDLAQLIAAHGQMYAPAPAAMTGPYGAGLSAAPPSQLLQARVTPMQIEPREGGLGKAMQSVNQAIDFGTNLGKVYKGGKEVLVGTPAAMDAKGNVIPATSGWFGKGGKWEGYHSGGRVGFAYGGMPYSNVTNPIVPEDIADPVQVTRPLEYAEGLGGAGGGKSGGRGGAGGLSQMLGLGSNLFSLGSSLGIGSLLALNHGGRVGKEGGGGLSDPVALVPTEDLFPKMLTIESGGRHFAETGQPTTSKKGAVGVAQVMPSTGPEAAKLAGVEWNPELFNRGRTGDPARDKEAEDYNRKLGQAYYNEQKRAFGNPVMASAAYNAGPGAVREAQEKARSRGGHYLDYLPDETQKYVSSLSPSRTARLPDALSLNAAPVADLQQPQPASKESWWDKESGGLSGTERAVISLLSGLGGMASSPSRFLAGSILSGLGAGANTYGALAQKGRALDISQQQANTAQGQLGVAQTAKDIQVLTQLRQIAAGYAANGQSPPAWLTQQISALTARLPGTEPTIPRQGHAPLPTSTATPSAPIAVAALPSLKPAEKTSDATPVKSDEPKINIADPTFRSKLGPDRDPVVLRDRARRVAEFDPKQATELRHQAQEIENSMLSTGKATDKDGNVIDVPGWAEQQASVGRVEPNQKWLDEQGTQALQRAQAREQLDVIKGVLENFESGSLAGIKAQAQALARGLGIEIPDSATRNAAEYQKFLKATLRNVFSDVKDMGGRPLVSEIQGFEKATASPELQPEANKEILAQLYGRMNQLDKYYGDTAAEMAKNKALDRGTHTNNWLKQKENGIAPLVEETKRDLAVRGATPSDIKGMKEGHAYIIEAGRFPGVTERGKYRLGRNEQGQLGLVKVQ